ncbi:putative metal transport system membrane [Gossypium arboreum]|uniref:Putative metal transport system membrane n=1 Tax=Gossypium arboreum TaxID=29729 RepID=A0A0B0M8J7_GOSAR|nr:putative metal transport system membrane [Gossypium arboreum]
MCLNRDTYCSYSYQGYPMPRDIPVWGLSVRGLGLGFEA